MKRLHFWLALALAGVAAAAEPTDINLETPTGTIHGSPRPAHRPAPGKQNRRLFETGDEA